MEVVFEALTNFPAGMSAGGSPNATREKFGINDNVDRNYSAYKSWEVAVKNSNRAVIPENVWELRYNTRGNFKSI